MFLQTFSVWRKFDVGKGHWENRKIVFPLFESKVFEENTNPNPDFSCYCNKMYQIIKVVIIRCSLIFRQTTFCCSMLLLLLECIFQATVHFLFPNINDQSELWSWVAVLTLQSINLNWTMNGGSRSRILERRLNKH